MGHADYLRGELPAISSCLNCSCSRNSHFFGKQEFFCFFKQTHHPSPSKCPPSLFLKHQAITKPSLLSKLIFNWVFAINICRHFRHMKCQHWAVTSYNLMDAFCLYSAGMHSRQMTALLLNSLPSNSGFFSPSLSLVLPLDSLSFSCR